MHTPLLDETFTGSIIDFSKENTSASYLPHHKKAQKKQHST